LNTKIIYVFIIKFTVKSTAKKMVDLTLVAFRVTYTVSSLIQWITNGYDTIFLLTISINRNINGKKTCDVRVIFGGIITVFHMLLAFHVSSNLYIIIVENFRSSTLINLLTFGR